jgi:hypothetical protein
MGVILLGCNRGDFRRFCRKFPDRAGWIWGSRVNSCRQRIELLCRTQLTLLSRDQVRNPTEGRRVQRQNICVSTTIFRRFRYYNDRVVVRMRSFKPTTRSNEGADIQRLQTRLISGAYVCGSPRSIDRSNFQSLVSLLRTGSSLLAGARCHGRGLRPHETISQALVGNDREEHIFALTQALELYDVYQAKVALGDVRIQAVLKRLRKASSTPVGKLPPARTTKKQSNDPAFDGRDALLRLLGCDVTQIHGLGPYLALKLVGECGTNLSAWPNAKHFTSWLCLSPSNKISGGKILSSRTRRSGSRAAALLRLAAVAVGRTRHRIGGVLPAPVGACPQGQGGHCHGPQNRRLVLQYPAWRLFRRRKDPAPPVHAPHVAAASGWRSPAPVGRVQQSGTGSPASRRSSAQTRTCPASRNRSRPATRFRFAGAP